MAAVGHSHWHVDIHIIHIQLVALNQEQQNLKNLQVLQAMLAHLLSSRGHDEHITPVVHYLLMKFRDQIKDSALVLRLSTGLALTG